MLWQATTVALVGIVIGVPLGIIVGRVVWNAFATNLGAVPVAAVPGSTIATLAIGVLVVANALAVIPAVTSARGGRWDSSCGLSDAGLHQLPRGAWIRMEIGDEGGDKSRRTSWSLGPSYVIS